MPHAVQARRAVGKPWPEVEQGRGRPEHYLRPLGGEWNLALAVGFATVRRSSSPSIPSRARFNEVSANGIIIFGVFSEGFLPGIRLAAKADAPRRKNS